MGLSQLFLPPVGAYELWQTGLSGKKAAQKFAEKAHLGWLVESPLPFSRVCTRQGLLFWGQKGIFVFTLGHYLRDITVERFCRRVCWFRVKKTGDGKAAFLWRWRELTKYVRRFHGALVCGARWGCVQKAQTFSERTVLLRLIIELHSPGLDHCQAGCLRGLFTGRRGCG